MGDSTSTIRVAIIGGGLAGTALLRGLIRYPHIAADMYESRPNFKEDRPAIELSPLAQDVLLAIDQSMDNCLNRAGAVYTNADYRVATGPLAGQRIETGASSSGKRVVGRQALLAEISAGVPPRMIHLNTRVTAIMEASPGNGLTLVFSDGSQKRYDVVIGADGVHGKTRAHVLGPDDPVQISEHSGIWSLPIKVPVERASQMMGRDTFDPRYPKQVTWIGTGTSLQHTLLGNGREVQVTAAATFDGSREGFSWAKLFTPEEFGQIFSRNRLEPCRGMIKLVQSLYTIQIAGICQMQHVTTSTYSSKNACLMGYAAHGSPSFHGASSSLALEEALVLVTLLSRTTSRSNVPGVLRAYDEVCRPRADFVARASTEIDGLMTGGAPGVGLDPSLLAKALDQKWDVIESLDIKAYCIAALAGMDRHSPLPRQW